MSHSKFDPQKHHRRSIRLPDYEYSQPGAYYVTIITWHRKCLFGEVVKGEVKSNRVGEIVKWEWLDLPKRFPYIELGAYVVMPNHFHGILVFLDHVGATRPDLSDARSNKASSFLPQITDDDIDGLPLPHGPRPASLGAVIAQFKSRITKRIWKIPSLKGTPIWQRNYHEHILRDEKDLKNKTDYINANPFSWEEDEENPLILKV
jgi:REP element-mobilizing transposase RayT